MRRSQFLFVGLNAGGEPIEEDVDICGNASPIMLDKDAQIKNSKFGSPSSSSSDSDSSSSGLCLTFFNRICSYYYRHSCVKKMLFIPVLSPHIFVSLNVVSIIYSYYVCH